jgi:hypothetical protein
MSYGPDLPRQAARAAYYVDRILKGAKPADLPVEQPREFDFIINLKTAQALGLTIPEHVLLQATEVIEVIQESAGATGRPTCGSLTLRSSTRSAPSAACSGTGAPRAGSRL